MRVLVTGGAGFIGSHVVDALMAKGHAVTVLDNLSSGNKDKLKEHLRNPDFRFIEGDIRDIKAIQESLADVNAVVHEAAMASVPQSVKEPELFHAVNVEGTLSLLKASVDANIKRFVFASSCSVYGNPDKLPVTEQTSLNPLSPYAQTKLTGEEHCRAFNLKGLPPVCFRYFNVYGPRQSYGEYAGVMMKFIDRLRNDQPPIIYGDGEQARDFVYVGDVANAALLVLDRDKVAGEVFNIGTGKTITINELCELFLKLTGKTHLKPIYEAARSDDIYSSQADISKARKLLSFEPNVKLAEGVKKLLKSQGLIS